MRLSFSNTISNYPPYGIFTIFFFGTNIFTIYNCKNDLIDINLIKIIKNKYVFNIEMLSIW
jgi:hypothetical protein